VRQAVTDLLAGRRQLVYGETKLVAYQTIADLGSDPETVVVDEVNGFNLHDRHETLLLSLHL